MMTVFPPSIMLLLPSMQLRREILLPVSFPMSEPDVSSGHGGDSSPGCVRICGSSISLSDLPFQCILSSESDERLVLTVET